ncbi:MAG: hypothetical protein AB1442_12145 [Nitrospirota bacterium]
MKRPVGRLFSFFLAALFLSGCASSPIKNIKNNPDAKYMLRMLAGGALGDVVAGNFGGFIVGSFLVDAVSMAKIEYEDRQVEDREEASRRLKNKFKQVEKKKPEEKKVEKEKEREKKAEELKEKEKKAEEKKDLERKAEEKKEKDKQAEKIKDNQKQAEETKKEEKKAEEVKEQQKMAEETKKEERKAQELIDFEKRAGLLVDDSAVTPLIAETGSKIEANVRYTVLGPEPLKTMRITETRILANSIKSVEIAKREISRDQGTHSSTIKFTISEDMPTGYCILYTSISNGEYTKTAKSEIIVNR